MDATKKDRPTPPLTSLQDLEIVEMWDLGATTPKLTTCFHTTPDDRVYFGESTRRKTDIPLNEYRSALRSVPDEKLYPEVPEGVTLTIEWMMIRRLSKGPG